MANSKTDVTCLCADIADQAMNGFPLSVMPAEAGIHVCHLARCRPMKGGYVYIMTNEVSGTLYVGVTADLVMRVTQHRDGTGSDFCKRYGLKRLVHVEQYDRIEEAIWREKTLKAWKRAWKLDLIEKMNPEWADLYLTII